MIRLAVLNTIGNHPIRNVGIAMTVRLFCVDGISYESGD